MSESNFIFFYGGPFSQWYPSFFVIDGTRYSCAEQYMMAMKAMLFGDDVAQARIMDTEKPWEQKAIGRTVENFDAEKWNKVSKSFVYRANLAKFSSNPMLKEYILGTGDKEIVEASPTDKIWGIGLSDTDPRRLDKTQWQGTNWLGEVIMQVRDTLRTQP